MTKTDDSIEEIVRAVYLYGYDRAKKGLNRTDGYTDDEVQALTKREQRAVLKAKIEELEHVAPKALWYYGTGEYDNVANRIDSLKAELKELNS